MADNQQQELHMTVRDQESLTTGLRWKCNDPTSKRLEDEASSRLACPNNKEFTLLYNGNIVCGNTCVCEVQTSTRNPLIAVTDRTKESVKCIIKFSFGTRDREIEFQRNDNIKNLIENCDLLPQNVTSIKNNGQEYRYNMEELIVKTYLYEPFEIEYGVDHKPPKRYKIKAMAGIIPPPHDYGINPQPTKDMLKSKGLQICDCDGDNGDDITLYYPGFQRFVDQCNDATYECRPEEYTFIEHVCTQMSRYMPKGDKEVKGKKSETIHQIAFMKLINQYLKDNLIPDSDVIDEVAQKIHTNQDIAFEPDDAVRKDGDKSDGYVDPCKCVILEVKNESGQGGGSDSYAQAIAYYVKTLEDKPVGRCPAPAFLLELVGPHLFISGAVYGKYVFVDRLVDPVWLVPQNQKAMIRIAQIFKALKDAIRGIRSYYTALPLLPPQYQLDQIRHPTITLHEVDNEKAEISITYTKRLQANMFEGIAPSLGNVQVMVHFVENYNQDVHDQMHRKGLAPEILKYAKAKETRYKAIIMKHIDGATSFADYLKTNPTKIQKETIFEECEKALATMHQEGLCHGKFTHKNILIQQQEQRKKIFVVNFQFSGKFREKRHGMIITQEGDTASLKQIKKLLEIQ